MNHQQFQRVGGLSLLFFAFLMIAVVAWNREEVIESGDAPTILGTWSWYGGKMQVASDGTCHWQGANREEHGKWTKAEGYLFDWGEKGNDWNLLSVDDSGHLSGRFVKWGGDLQGTRPEALPDK